MDGKFEDIVEEEDWAFKVGFVPLFMMDILASTDVSCHVGNYKYSLDQRRIYLLWAQG